MLLRFGNINEFGKWCQSNLLKHKVVILENTKEGTILQDTLLKCGYNNLNLSCKTIEEMVKECINHELVKNNLVYISYTQCTYEMEKVLLDLRAKNNLGYFTDMKINQEVAKTFYDTYLELHLEGVTSITELSNKDKSNSITAIFDAFKRELKNKMYVDKVELYNIALKYDSFDSKIQPVYIELKESKLSKVEEQIKRKFINEKDELHIEDNEKYSLKELKNKNVKYFSAQGESVELYEIIRNIKKEQIPFEEVAIYYTDNKYTQMMYELSQSMNLPVSFADGISISNSTQAKLIYSIIEWVKSGYELGKLFDVLNYISLKEFNKPFDEAEKKLTKSMIKNSFMKLNIVKGRLRYNEVLEREQNRLRNKISETNDATEQEVYSNKIDNIELIRVFITDLFEHIPDSESYYTQVIDGIIKLIKKYSIKNDEKVDLMKISSMKAIEEVYREFRNINDKIDILEILENIEESVREKTILSNRENGGAIYFTNYKNGMWIKRKYNFIVGLDNKKFPKNINENPLILDYEREEINKNGYSLELAKYSQNKEIKEMTKLINSREDNIVLSYCSFDTIENKPISPSYLFLQVVREVEGNSKIKYDELAKFIGNPKGLIPSTIGESLTTEEQWLYHIIQDGKLINDEIIVKNHNVCSRLREAKLAKLSNSLSIYEGKVVKDDLAPIDNSERNVSPTALETFASCPYKYFLKYILSVKYDKYTPQELEKWLDPREYGLLIHEIFESFYKELKSTNVSKDEDIWNDIMESISQKVIDKYSQEIPPVTNHSYNERVLEIKNICNDFVKNELETVVNLPEGLEFKFGREDNKYAEIEVGNKKIYVSGIVDRLDKIDDNTYQIIDYKTGDPSKYIENSFNKGLNLQNMFYALSLEKLLDLEGKIDSSKYYFTSAKGNFKKIGIDINDENKYKFVQILSDIFELMEDGIFIKDCNEKEKNSSCRYCDYASICRYDKKVQIQKNKLKDIKDTLLDKWEKEEGLAFYEC